MTGLRRGDHPFGKKVAAAKHEVIITEVNLLYGCGIEEEILLIVFSQKGKLGYQPGGPYLPAPKPVREGGWMVDEGIDRGLGKKLMEGLQNLLCPSVLV